MTKPITAKCHECCPPEFRSVHEFTGHHELDAVIEANQNRDIPHRLQLYLRTGDSPYGPRTNYNGYDGYTGDE